MTASVAAESSVGSTSDDTATGESPSRADRLVLAVAVGLTCLPIIVGTLALLGSSWWPSTDIAVEYLRSIDVGTRNTPLVGVQSRFGFNHPGPAMFYLFAPFVRVMGPSGMILAMGMLNSGCIAAVLWIAKRRAGTTAVLFTAASCLYVIHAAGSENLLTGWNPWVGFFPLLLAVFCAWSVCLDDVKFAPLLVVTGSFAMQSHVGNTVIVLFLLVLSVGGYLVEHRADMKGSLGEARSPLMVSFVLGFLMWLPPLIQQLGNDPGNVTRLYATFGTPTQPAAGLHGISSIYSSFFNPFVAWTGKTIDVFMYHRTGLVWPMVVSAAVLLLGTIAFRRGDRPVGMLAIVALSLNAIALWSGTRIQGVLADYLVNWMLIVSIVNVLSIALACVSILGTIGHGRSSSGSHHRFSAIPVGVLMLLGFSLASLPAARTTEFSDGALGTIARQLGDEVVPHLPAGMTYQVDWRSIGYMTPEGGFVARLESKGRHVRFPETPGNLLAYGSRRLIRNPTDVDEVVHVYPMAGSSRHFDPPSGEQVIVRFDRLTTEERRRGALLTARKRRLEGSMLRMVRTAKPNDGETMTPDDVLVVSAELLRSSQRFRGLAGALSEVNDEIWRLSPTFASFVVTTSHPGTDTLSTSR